MVAEKSQGEVLPVSRGRPADWWRPGPAPTGDTELIAVGDSNVSGSGVPFWALMGFTFITLVSPQIFFPWLIPLRIALVTAAVAITAHVVEKFIYRQPVMRLTREVRITACLVGWAVVTVPFSYWPGGSVSFLFGFYFKTLLIFWLLGNVVNTLTRLRQVAWGLSLIAVPIAWTAVENFLTGFFQPGGQHLQRIVGYEASPLTGNPNDLAMMLNLIIPFSTALFLTTRRPVLRSLLLFIISLNVAGVIVTFSRAGFLTLATIVALHLARLRRAERRWVVAALLVALACVPLLPSGYLNHLGTIADIESDPTGSAQKRWDNMVGALSFALANPIVGGGIGMSVLALNDIGGPLWTEVHNVYLQYAVEIGIPGLVLFLLLFVGCIKSARFAQRHSADGPDLGQLFYLAQAIEISLVAFAVNAFFAPVAYHFYFYYMAGLAIAAKAVCESEVAGARPALAH